MRTSFHLHNAQRNRRKVGPVVGKQTIGSSSSSSSNSSNVNDNGKDLNDSDNDGKHNDSNSIRTTAATSSTAISPLSHEPATAAPSITPSANHQHKRVLRSLSVPTNLPDVAEQFMTAVVDLDVERSTNENDNDDSDDGGDNDTTLNSNNSKNNNNTDLMSKLVVPSSSAFVIGGTNNNTSRSFIPATAVGSGSGGGFLPLSRADSLGSEQDFFLPFDEDGSGSSNGGGSISSPRQQQPRTATNNNNRTDCSRSHDIHLSNSTTTASATAIAPVKSKSHSSLEDHSYQQQPSPSPQQQQSTTIRSKRQQQKLRQQRNREVAVATLEAFFLGDDNDSDNDHDDDHNNNNNDSSSDGENGLMLLSRSLFQSIDSNSSNKTSKVDSSPVCVMDATSVPLKQPQAQQPQQPQRIQDSSFQIPVQDQSLPQQQQQQPRTSLHHVITEGVEDDMSGSNVDDGRFKKLQMLDRTTSLPVDIHNGGGGGGSGGRHHQGYVRRSSSSTIFPRKSSLKKMSSYGQIPADTAAAAAATTETSSASLSSSPSSSSSPFPGSPSLKRNVSFGKMKIREYNVAISDHPSCSYGPPIQLSWEYTQREDVTLDSYEHQRATTHKRRKRHELLLSFYERHFMLIKTAGYSKTEIRETMKEVERVKRERMVTDMFLPTQQIDEQMENVVDTVKRLFRGGQVS